MELPKTITTRRRHTKQPTSVDYQSALQLLGYSFAYNEMSGMDEVEGANGAKGLGFTDLNDHLESEIIVKMNDAGFHNETRIRHEIKYAASQNAYHPVQKYFESLPGYDGRDCIKELAENFIDADPLFPLYLRRWGIGAVGRIYAQTQNAMLVLDGAQGIGKSKFVQFLCPHELRAYYAEGAINPDNKDMRLRAASTFIMEVMELAQTTRRADVDSLKGFLSQAYVTERRPYGRQDERRPITASYIGTINNGAAGFLNDPSGSRRFMVTKIKEIDWKGYIANWPVERFWSQAYCLWKSGEPGELTADELTDSIQNNETYLVPDPIEIAFEQYFKVDQSNNFMPTYDILTQIRGSSSIRTMSDETIQRRLAEFLISRGAIRTKRNDITGKKVRGYENVSRI